MGKIEVNLDVTGERPSKRRAGVLDDGINVFIQGLGLLEKTNLQGLRDCISVGNFTHNGVELYEGRETEKYGSR